jgi:hypothetical protein
MIITHRYDSLDLRHGGTIRFVVDLCEAMARRGHDVLIACDEKGDRPAEIPEANSLSDQGGSELSRIPISSSLRFNPRTWCTSTVFGIQDSPPKQSTALQMPFRTL